MSDKILICAGGGSLGISQVRNLMVIRKNGQLNFTKILGTSTGNLTGVTLAFAPDLSTGLDNLINLYKNIKGTGDIFCGKASNGIPIISSVINFFTSAVDELVTSWPGTVSNSPLLKLLKKSIPHIKPCVAVTSFITSVENGAKIEVTANTDGTFTKTIIKGSLGATIPIVTNYGADWFPNYLLYVLASTAFPPECDATTIENCGGFVDGGLCRMVPIDVSTANADSVTVLLCGEWNPMENYSGSRDGLQYALRTISVVLFWQIQDEINDIIEECKENHVELTIYDLTANLAFPASDQFVPPFIQKVLNAPDPVPVFYASRF